MQSTTSSSPTPPSASELRPKRQGRFQMFSALRHQNYRYYWIGIIGYTLSVQMATIANGWLVYDLTNSPAYLGLVGVSMAAPTIVLTLFGGLMADMLDRRKLVLVMQILTAIVALAVAYLTFAGLIRVEHIIVASFLTGAFQAFDQPARSAMIPQLVEPESLMNAIALQSLGWQITRVAGPAIGGVIISVFGIATCFLVIALCLVAMIWAMIKVDIIHQASAANKQNMAKSMMEGLSYIKDHPFIFALVGMTFFGAIFGMSYIILMPVFARDVLHTGAEGFGLLMGASGIGALAGSTIIASLGNYQFKGRLMITSTMGFGLSLLFFAISQNFVLSMVLMVIAGLTNSLYMTTATTLLQANIPNELRGRIMAIYTMCWSLVPLGGMLGGAVATVTSAALAVGTGGALVAGMAAFAVARLPQIRQA